MIATVENYSSEMTAEIAKILIKLEFLEQFYYIFPTISNIDINDNFTDEILANKIFNYIQNQNYYSILEKTFPEEGEFLTLIKTSILEVFGKLNFLPEGKKLNLYELLPSLLISVDLPYIIYENVFNANLHMGSYSELLLKGNFFIEKYIRLRLRRVVTFLGIQVQPEQDIFLSRLEIAKFISDKQIQDQDISNGAIGVRVVYLIPGAIDFNLDNIPPDKQNQFLLKRTFLRKEKNSGTGEIITYNPIPIAYGENKVTSVNGMLILSGNENNFNISIGAAQKELVKTAEYERFFKYIFPIKSFNILSILEHMKNDLLLNDVIQKNNLFKDIKGAAINSLVKLQNLNNPRY